MPSIACLIRNGCGTTTRAPSNQGNTKTELVVAFSTVISAKMCLTTLPLNFVSNYCFLTIIGTKYIA